jgi:hypothetical protein
VLQKIDRSAPNQTKPHTNNDPYFDEYTGIGQNNTNACEKKENF